MDDLAEQLFLASLKSQEMEVLTLLQKGAPLNSDYYRKNSECKGRSPLHWACYRKHSLNTEYLIKWGASLSAKDSSGYTPLHWACAVNAMECVRILMANHSPTDIKEMYNRTAVDLARQYGRRDMAEFITSFKSVSRDPLSAYPSVQQLSQLKVNRRFELGFYFGLTEDQLTNEVITTAAILQAAKVQNMELKWQHIVEGLLRIEEYKLVESLCIKHGEGHTALSVSAFYGWLDFMKYLVDTVGLNPKSPVNKAGDTVLSIACLHGHIGVIDYLVKDKQFDPTQEPVNAAGNTLRSLAESHRLPEVIKYLDNLLTLSSDPQKYLQILDQLMSDTKNTILLRYFKMYFIGSSGIGKSTTRKRLTGLIPNLSSIPEEDRKHCSTHLAECTQVLAMMNENESKLTLKVSSSLNAETQMLFAYLYGNKTSSSFQSTVCSAKSCRTSSHPLGNSGGDPVSDYADSDIDIEQTSTVMAIDKIDVKNTHQSKTVNDESVTIVDVSEVIARLRSIVGSGMYAEQLQNKVLLNLIDVGGQPGFLEMLPFLSKGPGIFLAFFRLDKDLDEPCEVSYEHGKDKITPYKAIYTIRETLSQILSAVNHYVSLESDIDKDYASKLGNLVSLKPVATLIGTFKDEFAANIKIIVLREQLFQKFPHNSVREIDEVIKHTKENGYLSTDCIDLSKITLGDISELQHTVYQLLSSESFKQTVKKLIEEKLEERKNALTSITCNYQDLLIHSDTDQFFAVDNFAGIDMDLDPLRAYLQTVFDRRFKYTQLRIRPSQLLLGVILRKEYDIVSMDDCIQIGKALSMTEDEVKFAVWYLNMWVGALIYHPEIEDEDDWFKKNIICSPQVVFDSISSLIVESILELHSPAQNSCFSVEEKRNWKDKGQFSLETVKFCHSKESKDKVRQGKLIPVDKLVKFLEYSNLLSKITIKKKQGRREIEETMCFIPAILECASPEELTKSPPPDSDTPSSIVLTFECGYVPIGVFCALIGRLVSKGSAKGGILGMKWMLVESGIKRNLVSFYVDSSDHIVTLVAHVDCYEVRVIRQNRSISLHDLCSYVLSTMLFIIKDINDQLCPIISFICNCGNHKLPSDRFCQLSSGVNTCFKCKYLHQVTLKPSQVCWFAKEVKSSGCVSLKALPYARRIDKRFSFEWYKDGCIEDTGNVLKVDVTSENCDGYYTCEILKDDELFFSVYHCLKITKDEPTLHKDLLLDKVKQAIRELRSDWYSLAIELNIDYETRKAIEIDYRFVDVCFHTMLRHWVERASPPPTWCALIRALESPVIDHGSIASRVKTKPEVQIEAINEVHTPDPSKLFDAQTPLSIDKHLKFIRQATWPMRAKWYNLGVLLGIDIGTLKEIECDYQNKTNLCFTRLLEHWLTQSSPPTWSTLIEALRCPVIGHIQVTQNIETMLKNLHIF